MLSVIDYSKVEIEWKRGVGGNEKTWGIQGRKDGEIESGNKETKNSPDCQTRMFTGVGITPRVSDKNLSALLTPGSRVFSWCCCVRWDHVVSCAMAASTTIAALFFLTKLAHSRLLSVSPWKHPVWNSSGSSFAKQKTTSTGKWVGWEEEERRRRNDVCVSLCVWEREKDG